MCEMQIKKYTIQGFCLKFRIFVRKICARTNIIHIKEGLALLVANLQS